MDPMERTGAISPLESVRRIAEAMESGGDPASVVQVARRELKAALRLSSCAFVPSDQPERDAAGPRRVSRGSSGPAGASSHEMRLAMPVRSRGNVHGELRLVRPAREGAWSDEERLLVHLAATLLAAGVSLDAQSMEASKGGGRHDYERELGRRLQEVTGAYDELEALQGQLLQAEKMASVGHLAASLAHELDSPLSTILLTAEMTEAGSGPKEVESAIRIISAEADRCKSVIRNMLDFARRSRGVVSSVCVRDLLEKTLRLMRHVLKVRRVTVSVEVPESLAPLRAKSNQMQQVFFNLIDNAIDAMPEGGAITVKAQCEGDTCLLLFEDTGSGFEPAILPRVMEPFFTTKDPGKGTGLGLSICAGIIRAHGGTLQVGNSATGGGQVLIRVPFRGPDAAAEGAG